MATLFRLLVVLGLLSANQVAFADDIKGTQLADPRTPDDEKLLYAGPLPVKVTLVGTFSKVKEQVNGTLMMITEKHLYLRKDGEFRATIYPAAANANRFLHYVVNVEEITPGNKPNPADKPKQWQRTEYLVGKTATAKFTGNASDTQQPVGRGSALTNPQLQAYFFFSLQRLLFRIDDALTGHDELLLGAFKERSKEVADYLRANRYPDEFADEFAALIPYIDQQLALHDRINKVVDDLVAKSLEPNPPQPNVAAQRILEIPFGILQIFVGTIPRPEQAPVNDRLVERREYIDAEGVLNGMGTIFESQLRIAIETSRIQQNYESSNQTVKKRIDSAKREMSTNQSNRYQGILALGVSRLGVVPTAPSNPYEPIAKAIGEGQLDQAKEMADEKCKSDFKLSGRENPFAVSDAAFVGVTLVMKDKVNASRGDQVFRVAVRLAEAATALPDEPIFDFDRMDLYRVTASIASLAVFAESLPGTRGKVCSPRAMFAVRLLDTVKTLATIDKTGQAREQRALCLMLSGRISDAIVESESVRALRKSSPTFWYNLSRMYAVRSEGYFADRTVEPAADQAQSLNAFAQSLQVGFSQIREVLSAADFSGITRTHLKQIETLTTPRGKVAIARDRLGFTFTNQLTYPQTNVELKIVAQTDVDLRPQLVTTVAEKIPLVLPGETVFVATSISRATSIISVMLTSDQTLTFQAGSVKRKSMKLTPK